MALRECVVCAYWYACIHTSVCVLLLVLNGVVV